MRLHLQLCYQGTHYHGWQIQNPTHALQTIQGCVERAFLRLTGKHLRITGAGRTDSGVHALCQHAHCDLPPGIIRRWREGLNAYLPEDIRIISAEPCAPTFHARFDAIDKTYFYSFWTETAFVPPQRAKYVWPCGRLDATRMQRALKFILGEHDFASLQNKGSDVQSSIRTIYEAKLRFSTLPYLSHAPEICLQITANGFLKQMVRNLAGLLVKVGQGKLMAESIAEILEAKDRSKNPWPTAPAKGLTLANVSYRAGCL